MKKILLTLVVCVLLLAPITIFAIQGMSGAAATEVALAISLDGEPVAADPAAFSDSNSRTLVPVRFVSEAIKADVVWDSTTNTATITGTDGTVITITLGEKWLTVDGKTVEMDTAAVVRDNRIFVPVRYIGEALGLDVNWNAATNTVELSTTGGRGRGTAPASPAARAKQEVTQTSDTSDDEDVTIAQTIDTDGTYTLTGTINGQVLVTAENATLILDGANIVCSNGAGILGDDDDGDIDQSLTVELRGTNTVSGGTHGIQGKDILTLTGSGSVTVTAVKDGLHAGDVLNVKGGTITVGASFEGAEAPSVNISGGYLKIHASDDGINAASDDTGVRPNITVSGGTVIIYSGSDGFDSNGALTVSGGTVFVAINNGRDGNPFDSDGSASITPALFVNSAVSKGSTISVEGFTLTTEADATSVALILPGLVDGQTYTVLGQNITAQASTAGQPGMGQPGGMGGGFGGRGGGGFAPGGEMTPPEDGVMPSGRPNWGGGTRRGL